MTAASGPRRRAAELTALADRLDELAEAAELMGDEPTSLRLRGDAARRRDEAMRLLD